MKMKKVLIVGSSAKEYALAKKLSGYEIFVAPGNERISDIAKCVDIRKDNVDELLKFAINNSIDLTIVSSQTAIQNDIVSVFQANEQPIFAPNAKSAEITFSRSASRKFLYKLRIPAPHFGVYDKAQNAIDYLHKAPMPQLIHADNSNGDRLVCTTFLTSKTFVEDLFCKGEEKVVLEDYVFGHEFSIYFITDGYHALHLASVANYKFMEDGNGGIFTSGSGAYIPDYRISKEIEDRILKHIIMPSIESLQKKEIPYMGILGLDCVLTDDNDVIALNFKSFLSDHDAQVILNMVDEDLITLFNACINGSFEDYVKINTSDKASVSCVVFGRTEDKIITGINDINSELTPFAISKNQYLEYKSINGKNFVVTSKANTLSRARTILYEDLDQISFEGIKYRADICETVENF